MKPDRVTFSFSSDSREWDRYFAGDASADRGPSHVKRSTTSSRKPGAKIEGIVVSQAGIRVEPCSACAGPRFVLSGGPHGVHLVDRAGRHVSVDCQSKEVADAR